MNFIGPELSCFRNETNISNFMVMTSVCKDKNKLQHLSGIRLHKPLNLDNLHRMYHLDSTSQPSEILLFI